DRPLDVVRWHVALARLLDGEAQAEVGVGVTAALLGGDRNLARQLGEDRSALLVRGALLPLYLRPFGVAGHQTAPLVVISGWPQCTGHPAGQQTEARPSLPLTGMTGPHVPHLPAGKPVLSQPPAAATVRAWCCRSGACCPPAQPC